MTTLRVRPTLGRTSRADPPSTSLAEWAPVLAAVAEGALQRELDGELPAEAVARLKSEGFGALRVPVAYGGGGLDLVALTRLWIELAAVDANLPQAFRGHFALVEDRLWHHARVAATSACGSTASWPARWPATRGRRSGRASTCRAPCCGRVPTGPTGSTARSTTRPARIFAEWADVHARVATPGHPDEVEEATAIALVDTRDPGVRDHRRLERLRPARHRQRHDDLRQRRRPGRPRARRSRSASPTRPRSTSSTSWPR